VPFSQNSIITAIVPAILDEITAPAEPAIEPARLTPAAARLEFPRKLEFLFEPHWCKVLYGGRGGVKSWSIAQALLILGQRKTLRVLCCREQMNSIAESVHHLLEKQIERLGMGVDVLGPAEGYRVEKNHIYGPNGTEFAFTGLRDAVNIKSYEDFDIFWVEEAANVRKRSWDILLPTLRKEGAEIWISFNPELAEDESYIRFVLNPPPGAIVVKTSWRDNKWLTEELRRQKDHSEKTDPDGFLQIWEGHCKQTLDGAIYAHEIRAMTAAGHITRVPYDPALPVHTYWDLGIADCTSIWFVQAAAFEFRFIDFLQDRNRALPYYLQKLQERGYVYGFHNLPHDGKRRDLGTGKSIERHMLDAGLKVKIVPEIGLTNGMNSARNLFARAWFDEQKCADGLTCLRRYCWKVDPITRIYSKEPLHDDNSHGADAYRMAAVGLTEPAKKKEETKRKNAAARLSVWS
jgi:phage terminase large subunit